MTVGWVTSSPKLASKGDTKAALAMKEEKEETPGMFFSASPAQHHACA